MKKIKVGIIGCGTIGAALAKALVKKFSKEAELSFLCDTHPEKARSLVAKGTPRDDVKIVSLSELIQKSDLIIEAASAAISGKVARLALQKKKQVLIMSVGGLLKAPEAFKLAARHQGRLWIPSGAIVGIDGIAAGKEAELRSAKIVTRKPPVGIREAAYFKKHPFPELRGNEEVRVFKGNALAAVQEFPQNINVAAVLSLAGLGPKKTEVEIWTSNAYRFNRHEIVAEGSFGKIHTISENVPSPDNPKTSALAVYSAIAVLRMIFSSVRIGT